MKSFVIYKTKFFYEFENPVILKKQNFILSFDPIFILTSYFEKEVLTSQLLFIDTSDIVNIAYKPFFPDDAIQYTICILQYIVCNIFLV